MEKFNKLIQQQFYKMCQTGKLFRSYVAGDQLWTTYIESFGNDPSKGGIIIDTKI